MAFPFARQSAQVLSAQPPAEIFWRPTDHPPRARKRSFRQPVPSSKGRSVRFEPLEPRFLLSADGLINIAALEAGLAGDPDGGVSDAIQTLIDTDDNFAIHVPGLRLPDVPEGDNANPTVRELFTLDVDFDRDGSRPDRAALISANVDIDNGGDLPGIASALDAVTDEETALSLMDLDNSGHVSLSETMDVLFAGASTAFLQDFPGTKMVPDGGGGFMSAPTDLTDLINGFDDGQGTSSIGYEAFLNGLAEPTVLNSLVDLDVTVNSVGTGFEFDTAFSLTLRDDYLIDLGFASEQLEIALPTESPLPGASISPQPLATVEATFDMPLVFSVGTAADSFAFGVTDDLHLTADVSESLTGTTVNVGFLGMSAVSGSHFDLTLPFDVSLIDPSSPEHLGFRDGDFAAAGDGEISDADGVLTASDALSGDEFDLLYNVEFSLQLGAEGNSSPDPVQITVHEGDSDLNTTAGELAQNVEDSLIGTSLEGLISVDVDLDGKIFFEVVDTDASALGFNDQNDFAMASGLTGDNAVLDFASIADGYLFDAAVIMSLGGAPAQLVNFNFSVDGGNATDRRNDFIAKAQDVMDTAFGAGAVAVAVNSSTNVLSLTPAPADSLEITRTITMTADYNITSDELALAATNDYARLFETSIDPSNDNFEIFMELDAKSGITVTNGTLDGKTLTITADLVTDDGFGGVDYPLETSDITSDYTDRERFVLGLDTGYLTLSSGFDKLLDFDVLGGAEVINVVSQLGAWLDRLPTTDMLGDYDIPFADAVLGEHLDFAKIISDSFVYDVNDPDDDLDDVEKLLVELNDPDVGAGVLQPGFATAQELAQRLVDIGVMTSVADAAYDVGLKELTYEVEASETLPQVLQPIDFDLDLTPVTNISVEANVGVSSSVTIHTILGFNLQGSMPIVLEDPDATPPDDSTPLADLNAGDGVPIPTELALTGALDVSRIFGRLSGDANFAVSVNGATPVLVTIEANDVTDVTADNDETSDLVQDINDALSTAGLGSSVEAGEVGGHLTLTALGGVDTLEVFVSDSALFPVLGFGNPSYTELGFRDEPASTVTLLGAEIADPAGLSGTASFDVHLNGGGAETVEISVDDANTVNDLVHRINNEIADNTSLDGLVVAFRSGSRIGLAAVDASIEVFRVADDSNTSALGLSSLDIAHQVAGISLIGLDFLDETVDSSVTPELAFGRLSSDATFDVDIGGGDETIDLHASDTQDNINVGDLVDDLNNAISDNSNLDGMIIAEQVGPSQIALRAIHEDVTSISISTSAEQLGLLDTLSATPELRAMADAFAPFYYGPSSDATFTINYATSGGPQTPAVITISADEARDNSFIFQLVNDVNRALNDEFGSAALSPFRADFDGNRLVIVAKDGSDVTGFSIDSADDDPSVNDLKLYEIDTSLGDTPPTGPQTITADQADLLIYTADGNVHRIPLDGATTLQDVKIAIEASDLDGVPGPDITVSPNSTTTGLRLTDHTVATPIPDTAEMFRVTSVNTSRAVFALGIHAADINQLVDTQFNINIMDSDLDTKTRDGVIEGDEIGQLDLEDRLFLRQVDPSTDVLSADVEVFSIVGSAFGTPLLADFGFVGVDLNGFGDILLHVGIGLADDTGNTSLSDLVEAISLDKNQDGVVNVFDLREVIEFPTLSIDPDDAVLFDGFQFSVDFQPGVPTGFTLGASPTLSFELTDPGNPFNPPAGALTPFDGSADVNLTDDEITLAGHGYATGDRVVYRKGTDGTAIDGLTDGATYYVINVDANTLKLAETAAKAADDMAVDLLAAGAGANHRLQGFSPIAATADVSWSDLGSLANFADVDFDNILTALQELRDFLLEYAAQGALSQEIPVIGVSFSQLAGIASDFAAAVDDITNNPAGNIQALEQKIRQSFGLPEGSSIISLALVDDGDGDPETDDMLQISLDLSRDFSEPLNVDLDLGVNVDPFGEIVLFGQAGLAAGGGIDALLTVGIDLDDDGGGDQKGEVVLFNDPSMTHLNISLDATATNLFFGAQLGPLGVSVIDGDGHIELGLDFFDDSGTTADSKVAIADAFDGFTLDLTAGSFDLTLPIFFPTQSDFIGDVHIVADLELNGDALDLSVTHLDVPNVLGDEDFFTQFGLLSSMGSVIDAIDLLLNTLQDVMTGQIFGFPLPLIGDSLADGVEFIDDLRANIIDPFLDLIENTPKTDEQLADLIQGFLFAILGPGVAPGGDIDTALPELGALSALFPALEDGLGLLRNAAGTGDATDSDFADIDAIIGLIFDPETEIEWDFTLSDTFTPSIDFPFNLGFPALGLGFNGGLAAEISYDFGLGIGISLADGPYVNIDRRDGDNNPIPELTLTAEAGFQPGSALEGRLGFLEFTAEASNDDVDGNNIDDNNNLAASFTVDLVNGAHPADGKLSFFEIGDLDFIVDFSAEAHLALDLTLGFNSDLLPPVVAGIMPNLEALFLLDWAPDPATDILHTGFDFDIADGLQLVKFENVAIDLGSFLGDFLGPIVSQIQEYTEPLQPIIDVITAPIPGISDLAGRPISLVDIAAEFGEFDPGMIYAIADIISFVNSIPATTDSIKLVLGDFTVYGSGILSADQLADPTFNFADATAEGGDLFDVFNNLLGDSEIIQNAVQIFDEAGNFLSGVFDGALDSGANSTSDAAAGVLGGGFDTEGGGFDFPFLKDPKQIFGALLGRPMVLVTYDLPPLGVEVTWEQSFMIYGPLWGVIGLGLGVHVDLAFGYDTYGIEQFAKGGFQNPLDLVAGFYISDTNMPDGSGPDVPELQLIGEMSVGAELNAGVASAGVQAAIILTVNFDLNDPDMDGRVRIHEILGNFLYELNYGSPALAPIAIFDVSGDISLQIRAYLKILLAKFTFEITPPITLFEFSIDFDREPILATERGDGSILLNMGPNAASRLHGNTDDIAEHFYIKQEGNDILIWAPDLNVGEGAAQVYHGNRIVGFGGEFDDQLEVRSSVTLPVLFEGQSGNDIILAEGTGGGILSGGVGNDTITGGDGQETIYGNDGNDVIDGAGGNDLIFGDFGRVSTRTDGMGGGGQNFGFKETDEFYRRISVLIGEKDGNDTISGGSGDDVIFGGGGRDSIGGDADASMLDAAGDDDLIFGDGGRMLFERNEAGVITLLTAPTIRSTDNLGDQPDLIHGQGGDDTVYGGGGDDEIDGGADDDVIYGESGFDLLSGGGDSDKIYGGDQNDVIYGFRIEGAPGDPNTDGGDTIEGGDGNDFIRGNQGNDVIEGGRGADIIFGDEDNDHIIGEAGPDFIFGGADDDTVDGGEGNDIVFGDDGLIVYFDFATLTYASSFVSRPGHEIVGDDRLVGDVPLGADPFASEDDDDPRTLDLIVTEILPTDGDDYVVGGEADDIIIGGDGDDTLFGDFDPAAPPSGPIPADDDILIGDAGRVEFQHRLRDRIATVVGATAGDDELSGNGGSDVLLAGGGSDMLWGRMDISVFTDPALEEEPDVRDDDILIGDDGVVDYEAGILSSIFTVFTGVPDPALTGGVDVADGGKHNDIILGGFDGDTLTGALDEDVILGDNGQIDYLLEDTDDQAGNDSSRIQIIFTTDTADSTGGGDVISGDEANDVILGGAGGDEITGGDNRDVILGDNGEVDYGDVIGADPARPGLDFVRSLTPVVGGADTISGGGDKDIVIGGSAGDTIFGDDDLLGGSDPSPDEDVLIGDQGEVEFDDDLFDPADLVDGMLPDGVTPLPAIVRIETTDDLYGGAHNGGSDTIEGNEAIDVILGGVEGDVLRGNADDDIILGDEGVLRYDGAFDGPVSMAEAEIAGLAPPTLDDDPFSLDLISTKAFDLGGDDVIFGNADDDIALGGTGADTMLGDNDGTVPAGPFDQVESTPGQDILIGDQGRVTLFDAAESFANNITRIESTDAQETDGDGDYIEGNDFADIILGGVNGAGHTDILHGEADLPDYVGTPGEDLIVGDEGILRFDVLPAEGIPGTAGTSNATLDQIRTFKTGTVTGTPAYLGGTDLIFGNDGGDVAIGGTDGDFIYGDLYANDATNLTNFVDSATPGPDTLLGDGGELKFIGFEVFNGALNADTVTILRTIEPGQGGADVIEGHEFADIVMGGYNDDTLFGESDDYLSLMTSGGAGNDVILGDNGELTWILQSDTIANRPDVSSVDLDNDGIPDHDLDRISTTNPTLGGMDRIEGNGGADAILGGTDSDLIWGDTPDADPIAALADPHAEVDGADGNDLIFGDHGKLYPNIDTAAQPVFINNFFFSIDTLEADAGNSDIMFGNGADDIMIGGQGDDLMWGNDGDDDMIGGHNVALGDDDLDALDPLTQFGLAPTLLGHLNPAVNKEFNDLMDGGTDDDVMAGDNAVIIRRTDALSPRFRMIGSEGPTLHVLDTVSLAGLANVDVGFHANIGGPESHLDMTLVRDVYLLDHDEATQDDALSDQARRRFGNDVMVGGLNDDEMFGQLGDDIIQGDGTLTVTVGPVGLPEGYDPAQGADPSFDARDATIDGLSTRLSFDVFEDLSDGNDYIEGNGGSDRVYGGLGQDDIIGGSSTLFFYGATVATDRPDGADLLYGGTGNGNVMARNAEFGGVDNPILTGVDTIVPDAQRHAFDADAILGDNGEIYQIVSAPLTPAVFNYEDPDGTYDGGTSGYTTDLTVRVRAINLLDYGYEYVDEGGARETLHFLASARGAGDLIYGETGDDIMRGMTGNDVIYGNGEDDDLYGGIGTDILIGGTGRDGILGDDGLILTSRNVAGLGEPLNGIAPLDPDEGPLKHNEEVNLNSINAVIETPGSIQRAVINVLGELNKSVETFAFRTDDVELSQLGLLGEPYRFNDIIFGGLGQDFIHAGEGDDAVSGAEALPTYYSGDGFGFEAVDDFLVLQQTTTNVLDPDDPAFSFVADLPFWYRDDGNAIAPFNPGDILRFQDRGNADEFALYDEFFPRRKIMLEESDATVIEAIDSYVGTPIDFLLNFDPSEGPDGFAYDGDDAPLPTDGDDRIFGDLGNDWIVGGTGRDNMWGGRGFDLLNMDDNHDSGPGGTHPNTPPGDSLDNTASDEFQAYADIAYGGGDRDVLILNTGADRAIDWVGEYNSYLVPFSPFGAFDVSRTVLPQLPEFLYALSDSDGADVTASVGDPALIPAVPDAQLYVDQKLADVRTDDPDPARNHEPFGELGLVLQQDRDWQSQTGAPSDPQPGNLQGQREIMRRELFNDGPGGGPGGGMGALTFAADVGDWSVSSGAYNVAPTTLGEESVSIHYLDMTIPSYVEILVTANAEKDKAGYKSDAYIIFDYQSDTDFKFAGIDAGLDKIRIGHRTEDGWVVDTQSNLQLAARTDYELTLTLHGAVATIYVDGANATSFAFGDALNDGLLGLGTDNAKATFDDWQVQKLPPVITLEIADEFDGESAYVAQSGQWTLADGALTGSPAAADYAVATQPLDLQVFARLWVETALRTDGLGGVVYDYDDTDNFKFVALDATADQLLMGHVRGAGLVIDNAVAFAVDPSTTYDLNVSVQGSSVSVEIDGTVVGGHSYASILNDGEIGLFAVTADAVFERASIRTDDPAYASPEPLLAATAPLAPVGIDAALSPAQLASIVTAAKQRWAAADGITTDALTGIDATHAVIADLDGLNLAQLQEDNAILVDPTAAGFGWFVDPTPFDDSEFSGPHPSGGAAGHIDLLTALLHEMGHAAGLEHSTEPGLMAATLDTGQRFLPPSSDDLATSEPLTQQAVEEYEVMLFEPSTGSFSYAEAPEDGSLDGEYYDLLSVESSRTDGDGTDDDTVAWLLPDEDAGSLDDDSPLTSPLASALGSAL